MMLSTVLSIVICLCTLGGPLESKRNLHCLACIVRYSLIFDEDPDHECWSNPKEEFESFAKLLK